MVINGEAAMQIMGDWAKGEFANAGKKFRATDYACIPVPKAKGDGFVYLVNSLSLFTQTDPELIKGQEVLASAIMDPSGPDRLQPGPKGRSPPVPTLT